MDLAKLVSVLQSAKEGSEYLDYAIQRLFFAMAKPVPTYSRSLDAAMLLMPDGWSIHRLSQLSDCHGGFAGWVGDIYRGSDAVIPYPSSGTAATAPLAICLAAIRVRLGEVHEQEAAARGVRPDFAAPAAQRSGTH